MPSAASRFRAFGALAFLIAACHLVASGLVAAPAPSLKTGDAGGRAVPSRPETKPAAFNLPTSFRLGASDFVSATDIASGLGLGASWTEANKLTFVDKTDPSNRAEIEADGRNARVNGLRVFLGEKSVLRKGKLYLSRTDVERCLIPLLRPGLGVVEPAMPRIIALDPGHGGKDEGTASKKVGLKEKNLTLDVALRLRNLLQAAGYKVVMIRTEDKELSTKKELDLAMRADLANRAGADLFISIHFNAAVRDTRGTEIFTFAPKSQHSTEWWGTIKTEDSYRETDDQPVNRFDHWSVVFAQALHRRMLQTLKTEDRGKKIAHWAVLKTLNCPGVLVEPAIITNDAEARRAATPAFRQQTAEALAAGIRDYVATLESIRLKSTAVTRLL